MREGTDDTRDRQPAPAEVAQTRADLRDDGVGGGAVAPRTPGRARETFFDRVSDASIDSFPASDPPSWSGMRLGPPG